MPLYKLTYPFELSGGNVEYQVTQQVRKDAETHNTDVTHVTTGLSLEHGGIKGSAIVEVSDDVVPTDVFESATAVHQLSAADTAETTGRDTESKLPDDPFPAEDIPRFEESSKIGNSLGKVSETPGRGLLLYSNLSWCRPHERDLWLVPVQTTELDANTDVTKSDIVEFYRSNLDLLEEEPALKIGVFHAVAEPVIRLFLVASLTDPQEAKKLAERTNSPGAINAYRFELAKESLVIGTSTHGPGQVNAVFRNSSGDDVYSRDLAYRIWLEGLEVSFHPLGVVIDGELYRPVTEKTSNAETTGVGEPLDIKSYRGSDATPWQFGVTRHDGQLLITQARGPPEKFDPVLKRFPIETRAIGAEPLVFSHTVSRRVWSEDPLNTQIQSQRSEGLRTQFLYAEGDDWHLIQPDALGDTSQDADSSFEQTQVPGVSVRSSLLRTETDGDSKATVEHEYRITTDVLDSCSSLYVLSYYEANEESIGTLEWEIADAVATEIVHEKSSVR